MILLLLLTALRKLEACSRREAVAIDPDEGCLVCGRPDRRDDPSKHLLPIARDFGRLPP